MTPHHMPSWTLHGQDAALTQSLSDCSAGPYKMLGVLYMSSSFQILSWHAIMLEHVLCICLILTAGTHICRIPMLLLIVVKNVASVAVTSHACMLG